MTERGQTVWSGTNFLRIRGLRNFTTLPILSRVSNSLQPSAGRIGGIRYALIMAHALFLSIIPLLYLGSMLVVNETTDPFLNCLYCISAILIASFPVVLAQKILPNSKFLLSIFIQALLMSLILNMHYGFMHFLMLMYLLIIIAVVTHLIMGRLSVFIWVALITGYQVMQQTETEFLSLRSILCLSGQIIFALPILYLAHRSMKRERSLYLFLHVVQVLSVLLIDTRILCAMH